jgi:hypothetical protein
LTISDAAPHPLVKVARSRQIITEADRRFPARARVAIPEGGLGVRLNRMHAWPDENCGADGWIVTPTGLRVVVNDAVAVYSLDAALASAFVARWCRYRPPDVADGAFVVRDDEPAAPSRASTLRRHYSETPTPFSSSQ